jgi:predicted permease
VNRTVHLFFTFIISGIVVTGCKQHSKKVQVTNKDISQVLSQMTELMVHDVTNPPLASRFFSYACLAGYEVVSEKTLSSKACMGF